MAERALVSKEKALQEGQLSKTEDKNTKFTNTLTGNTKITTQRGQGGPPQQPVQAPARRCQGGHPGQAAPLVPRPCRST
jgi:hypothetical protein